MKIAVFIKATTFHKGHGGLEIQNRIICEELAKRGHVITIFSPKRELELETTEKNGVSYVFINADYKNYIFSSVKKNSWYKKSLEVFTKYHETSKFDLVLSQSASAESIIEHKNILGVKVVSIAHGSALSEFTTYVRNVNSLSDVFWLIRNTQYFIRQYFGRQRKYVLHSNKIIAVSNYVKNALLEETFVSENRVEVVYNGINPSDYSDLNRENENKDASGVKERVDMYFIGRVEKSKGIFTILDVVKKIKDPFTLHIVGDGTDLVSAKDKAERLGLADKVIFHGKYLHSDFIKLFKPDILVFPTKRIEGFPMVLVESMFAGLPVVAFNMGGVVDAVDDAKTGYLVKAGDIKEFRNKLVSLMENSSLRGELGKNAKEKALKLFTLDKMIDAYEQVFREVLK
jgi:glycosyltransferase involved in cell wall biosynthesis